MKVYLDLVMFINFFLDFLLLMTVSIILKRKASIKRLICASFIGGLSIIFLFLSISSIELFLLKLIISIFMALIAFKYINIKYFLKNLLYLYIVSIFLGGGLYFLNDQFSVHKKGLVFINNGFSITIFLIIIISPIILYLYIKQSRDIKNNYNNYYDVLIKYNKEILSLTGFLDSGNNLEYLNKKVILVDNSKITFNISGYLYIPYQTVSGEYLLKAFKPNEVIINNIKVNNVLVGIIESINLDGVSVILNNNIKEII